MISGKTGSGKTYAACALGNNACRHGYTVKYFRIPELLLEIRDAKNENRCTKFMTQLQNIKLLILDDIGLKSYNLEESRDILEIAESRYNKGSMVLADKLPILSGMICFQPPRLLTPLWIGSSTMPTSCKTYTIHLSNGNRRHLTKVEMATRKKQQKKPGLDVCIIGIC